MIALLLGLEFPRSQCTSSYSTPLLVYYGPLVYCSYKFDFQNSRLSLQLPELFLQRSQHVHSSTVDLLLTYTILFMYASVFIRYENPGQLVNTNILGYCPVRFKKVYGMNGKEGQGAGRKAMKSKRAHKICNADERSSDGELFLRY